jgi:hypothetical protein
VSESVAAGMLKKRACREIGNVRRVGGRRNGFWGKFRINPCGIAGLSTGLHDCSTKRMEGSTSALGGGGGSKGRGGVGVCGTERVVNQLGAGWAMEFSCNSGIRRGRERKSGGWLWVWLWVVVVDGVTRGGLGWQV